MNLAIRARFAGDALFYETRFAGNARFHETTFTGGANFQFASFAGTAEFQKSSFLFSAIFSGATFAQDASFGETTFEGDAVFGTATFAGTAGFRAANFAGNARFDRARFAGITASGPGALFVKMNFRGEAHFTDAVFGDGADFQHAHLGGNVDFTRTKLPNADLRDIRGFVPDETFIRGAHFSARAPDPWSRLRAAYTGPRLFFNLLFLTLFFLPFIARTAGWVMAGHAQREVLTAIHALQDVAPIQEDAHPEDSAFIRTAIERLRRNLADGDAQRWHKSHVWKAVLGVDQGPRFWIPAVMLLFYNLGRGWLTFLVAPMRDAEERSGYTPSLRPVRWQIRCKEYGRNLGFAKEEAEKWKPKLWQHADITRLWVAGYLEAYGGLIWQHKAIQILLYVAIALFVWNAWVWLSMSVWLPAQASHIV